MHKTVACLTTTTHTGGLVNTKFTLTKKYISDFFITVLGGVEGRFTNSEYYRLHGPVQAA